MLLPGQIDNPPATAVVPSPSGALPVITCVGCDPGLASFGMAAVARRADGSYVSRGVKLSRTEPAKGKEKSRVAVDDQRRVAAHVDVLLAVLNAVQPEVIAIENYAIFEPKSVGALRDAAHALVDGIPLDDRDQVAITRAIADRLTALPELLRHLAETLGVSGDAVGLGQAAKTVRVFGAIEGIARARGIPVFVFQPSDLKTRFGGKKSASKDEVRAGVEHEVKDLAEDIAERVPQRTLKEHVGDAAGHAVLGLEAYHQLRLDVGVGVGVSA